MLFKEFLIRPATNNDIPSIKNVVFSSLEEYGLKPETTGKDIDLNNIERNYFSNNGFFGVAVDTKTNHIVGTFGLFSRSTEICELRKMYLIKEVRGQGLGKFILNSAIRIAKEKQYKKIILETISQLTEAIFLYKQSGFKEVKAKEINKRVDQAFELNII
jgi:GNAT superfamily N-acetyltransferase